jgi:enoyl-CoA hydratase/carnithine racemase
MAGRAAPRIAADKAVFDIPGRRIGLLPSTILRKLTIPSEF